jgi:hypothetical protein
MRLIPQVRALRAATSRRRLAAGPGRTAVRQVIIGLVLLGPAGLWLAAAPEPGPGGAVAVDEAASPAGAQVEAVTRMWAAMQLESQRQAAITTLAGEFDVPEPLAEDIHDAAVSEAIEPRLAFGLVRAESSFRSRAVSPVGAVGLTQLMPATRLAGARNEAGPDDARSTSGWASGICADCWTSTGRPGAALTAYNRGPGTVDRLLSSGRDPDNGYAEKVLTGESRRHVSLMNVRFGRSQAGT